ncbi:MAG: hypothetical protein ACR2KQ_01930 [Actinomycetota bacterium]
MKIYAETPHVKTRQIVFDILVVIWILVWIRIGMAMHDLIAKLSGPGRTIESAGAGFSDNLQSLSERAADVPLVGDRLRAPFDSAAGAGRELQAAGVAHQEIVMSVALWLGILLAVIPIGYVLLRYLPDRIRWVREASAAARLRIDADDLHLFALRAIATKPLYELRRACSDPARCLVEGNYRPLAAVELASLGLKDVSST